MMKSWRKSYHKLYTHLKFQFDPRVIQWISEKEEIIISSPFSFGFLGYELAGIRKYKGGKLRILYTLSTEKADIWETVPGEPEAMFIYVDLRSDETYKDALKLLRKHGVL